MILGVFLRHIKVYKAINFIPLSDGKSFCGLVGDNGIGKSTVLEALDVIFNAREWNINIEHNRAKSNEIYIVPIFCIKKELVSEYREDFEKIDRVMREIDPNSLTGRNIVTSKKAKDCIDLFIDNNIDNKDYYIFPIGLNSSNNVSFGIYNATYRTAYGISTDDGEQFKRFLELFKYITSDLLSYIYIPKELGAEDFTKLHNKQFQSLMGKSLEETLGEHLTRKDIQEINSKLDSIISGITSDLKEYEYRTEHSRQQRIKRADVYNLIMEAYFGIRHIHQKRKEGYIPLTQLSSGEKQKAIINITHSLLEKRKTSDKEQYVILGIDEPESSLHISACFDIFQKLYEISFHCEQVIFTSHWYGFLPSVIDGNTTVISQSSEQEHFFDFINISKYREETKQLVQSSDRYNRLPSSIKLKSMNDLVQSIVCASMGDNPFSWLICEGSSEKIYFNFYFEDLVESGRLRILPVGSYKEVRKLYDHLSLAFKEYKHEITGKTYLLIDTDENSVSKDGIMQDNEHPNLRFRKLALIPSSLECIEEVTSNRNISATELEDVLHAETFKKTLESFKDEYESAQKLLDCIGDVSKDFYPSGFSINLSPDKKIQYMENFFDLNQGRMKLDFAEKYISLCNIKNEIPWINKIREFFN